MEFVNPGKGRLDVPFADLLAYLKRSFLPSNDLEHVRENMEALRQISGESLRTFNRKFRDLSELAYPSEQRTDDQGKLLIKLYIKGLHSRDIARNVLRESPTSLQDAMATAVDSDEVENALQRMGHRNEEPMDVSAAAFQSRQEASWTSLSKQIAKMNTKLAKMELQMQHGGPSWTPRCSGKTNSRTANGKPICFSCKIAGHIAKYCPKKVQGPQSTPMDVSPAPPPYSRVGPGKLLGRPELCPGRPFLRLELDTIKIEGLLDTGSSRTLLAAKIFFKLVNTQRRTPILSPSDLGLQSVTGHRLLVLGKTQIHIKKAGCLDVYIVDGLHNDLILGIDSISKGQGHIDFPNKTFFWFKQKWPLLGEKLSQIIGTLDRTLPSGHPAITELLSKFKQIFSHKTDPLRPCTLQSIKIVTEGTLFAKGPIGPPY